MRLEEDDLLADEADCGEPPHGDADEIRRDDNARDERLDAIDEAHLRVRVEPGRGDHDVAHARGADDALRIVEPAEDGIFRRERLADGMIVEESDDPIVKPRVELKRADDAFRRPSRPDKEHRHTEESERVDAFPADITPRPKQQHDEKRCEPYKKARDRLAELRKIKEENNGQGGIDRRPEDAPHDAPKRNVLHIRPPCVEKPEKQQRHDAVEIYPRDLRRLRPSDKHPLHEAGEQLRRDDRGIVDEYRHEWEKIRRILFPQRQSAIRHISSLSKQPHRLTQKHPAEYRNA